MQLKKVEKEKNFTQPEGPQKLQLTGMYVLIFGLNVQFLTSPSIPVISYLSKKGKHRTLNTCEHNPRTVS